MVQSAKCKENPLLLRRTRYLEADGFRPLQVPHNPDYRNFPIMSSIFIKSMASKSTFCTRDWQAFLYALVTHKASSSCTAQRYKCPALRHLSKRWMRDAIFQNKTPQHRCAGAFLCTK